MKQCFVFLTTKIESYSRYCYIRNCGTEDIDFFFVIDSNDNIFNTDKSIIKINGNYIWEKYNGQYIGHKPYEGNTQFTILEFYKQNPDYDYYWFCEDDIFMHNGDYCDFFMKCNNIKSDLLLSKNFLYQKDWYWNTKIERHKDSYPVHTWVQLFRLSNIGCKVLIDNFNKEDKAHTECYIPSVLYTKKYDIKIMEEELDYKFNISWMNIFRNLNTFEKNTFYHPLKI